MSASRIVILGGSVGGTLIANLLAGQLSRRQAEITLVDRTGIHVYQPGWLYVPFGGAPPERWERRERSLLKRSVQLVIGDVAQVDPVGQTVALADGTQLPYDFLVIATGARLAPEVVPGYAEAAHHFYSAEAALRLHAALREFKGGKIVIGVADIPYKCPPAPLEFTFMLEHELRERGLREQSEIVYLSPIGRVFTIASVAEFVTPLLEERGIAYETFFNTEEIDPQARTVTSLEGTTLSYDLLVMEPPHRGADFIVSSGLGDSQGWVSTDRETLQHTRYENIYAIGDATDLPVSKSGAAAHFEARTILQRIAGAIKGKPSDARYNGQVMCFLETGGDRATQLVFDYEHPPQPPKPSAYYHYEKALLNRAYWHLIPTGVV